jgi:hypothetical protein
LYDGAGQQGPSEFLFVMTNLEQTILKEWDEQKLEEAKKILGDSYFWGLVSAIRHEPEMKDIIRQLVKFRRRKITHNG